MADSATLQEIIDYYTNLLIIQYNNLPNARAQITLYVTELIANGVIFDVRDGYDLDTAVGVQLDVLGKYIGADRFYTGQDLTDFFSFATYDTDPIYGIGDHIGYADYDNVGTKAGKFLTYDDVLSQTYALNDADFRTLLKLKILQNNSNHSDKEINDGIFELFGNLLIPQDNYDMTMDYFVDPSIAQIIDVANEKGLLPKPMGVKLNIISQDDMVITDDGDFVITDDGQYVTIG